ncbi:hypothetical protein BU25DRAFT_424353 [Macroventuria anomochaeta]|uniref:Uncharacterized protein n=1 Tax=Macroventuria anomochaeta TaxID=301207 RepID=A0ACB6RQF1_9PLEO|nr:uncharacterized protein BU25DRAFT_424353 [Macroventuria anomochaeta]KAF2623942.1 hypothetical protein BU25DRAFT_424353 [Macroventuria anomochaeta]
MSASILLKTPDSIKRMQLFMFFSYAAVVEKRLMERKSKEEKLKSNLVAMKRSMRRSIIDENLNIWKDAQVIQGRYEAINNLDTAIENHDKTIESLDLAVKNLNKVTAKVLRVFRVNLEAKAPSAYNLKTIRRGALNLHEVIATLVDAGWTPALATLSVMSRSPPHYARYSAISSKCAGPIAKGLTRKGPADLPLGCSDNGGSDIDICVAGELTKLDPSLWTSATT